MRYNYSVIDLYDRNIVASENGKWITTDLALRTLDKAIHATGCEANKLILHSDHDSQFTSLEFILACKERGLTQSMSEAGCHYDNSPMERYYNTLKEELIKNYHFDTIEELDYAVSEYAYGWYSQIRPHSYNGYLTPFEKRYGLA